MGSGGQTPAARSRSRRRDDGSGQAAQLVAAIVDCANREIGRPILIRHHQVAAPR
jgi:hypothetical protein